MEKKMKIEKEYNVQGLADKVKGCIKTVCETKSRNVSLDVITAQEIVDVLETVASWENKRTKLRDIREEILKQNCFGTYEDNNLECQCCDSKKECMNRVEEREGCEKSEDLAKCFGRSYGRRYTTVCKTCKYKEQCKELTKHE